MIYAAYGAAGILIAGMLGLLWLMRRDTRRMGGDAEKLKSLEGAVDDVKEANAIRDRLAADPSFAKRVRDRFTRP